MTEGASPSLPSFDRPPVWEVVCNVTFKSLERFLTPHLGQLWGEYVDDYPKCSENPPLVRVVEAMGGPPETGFEVSNIPPMPRVWFMSEDETKLIQVQRDRFLHNWKRAKAEDTYPRYAVVIEWFKDKFADFETFITNRELGIIEPIQYEMAYVNHIPQGGGWDSLGEIEKLFPDFGWRTGGGRFLPEPESVTWKTSFALPGQSGRLHAVIQTAIRTSDHRNVIRLDLNVRGLPADKSRKAMYEWFDMARRWIVLGFTDMTSEKAQTELWKRTQ